MREEHHTCKWTDYCSECEVQKLGAVICVLEGSLRSLNSEGALKDAVIEAVQAFVDKADSEGLLIGCGENYPGEKEGKCGKRIRKALAALVSEEHACYQFDAEGKCFECGKSDEPV